MLFWKRSVKMRRSHRSASQRKRRAWRISTAHRPAIGKSAKRPGYRLWMRPETMPQEGHALFMLLARIVMTALSTSLQRLNRKKPRRQQRCGVKRLHGAVSLLKPGHTGASTSSKVNQSHSSTPIDTFIPPQLGTRSSWTAIAWRRFDNGRVQLLTRTGLDWSAKYIPAPPRRSPT